MKTDYIDYQDGDDVFEGYFAWDETLSDQQPVVLIAHDWAGRRELACSAAESMVDLGYAGFAVDIYGKGIFGKDADTAGNSALMMPYVEDRALLRQRMLAALNTVRALGHDDPMVPQDQVLAFDSEMTAQKADWQMHIYGGTSHAFTNPDANDKALGTIYSSSANQRAQRLIADFLAEIFA